MLELKSCPRCLGDMLGNSDMYGEYKQCLQCGFLKDVEPPAKVNIFRAYIDDPAEGDEAA
jgi:hypothetical protein